MIRNKLLSILVILVFILKLNAQTAIENLRFAAYLTNSFQYSESKYVLNSLSPFQLQYNLVDSLHFLKAKNHYYLKELAFASVEFEKVSRKSFHFVESQYFGFICNCHLGSYNEAKSFIFKTPDSDLKIFSECGLLLLERNINAFDSIYQIFNSSDFKYSPELNKLISYRNDLKNYRRKSPLLAGSLSAIVPGLGKVYAGAPYEGVAAFGVISFLALVTTENYIKAGISNYKTILFGTAFTTFYLGNIWGSVVKVKIKNQDFNHGINQQILFDIHIPIRSNFN